MRPNRELPTSTLKQASDLFGANFFTKEFIKDTVEPTFAKDGVNVKFLFADGDTIPFSREMLEYGAKNQAQLIQIPNGLAISNPEIVKKYPNNNYTYREEGFTLRKLADCILHASVSFPKFFRGSLKDEVGKVIGFDWFMTEHFANIDEDFRHTWRMVFPVRNLGGEVLASERFIKDHLKVTTQGNYDQEPVSARDVVYYSLLHTVNGRAFSPHTVLLTKSQTYRLLYVCAGYRGDGAGLDIKTSQESLINKDKIGVCFQI